MTKEEVKKETKDIIKSTIEDLSFFQNLEIKDVIELSKEIITEIEKELTDKYIENKI